jgi:hypothetical protein
LKTTIAGNSFSFRFSLAVGNFSTSTFQATVLWAWRLAALGRSALDLELVGDVLLGLGGDLAGVGVDQDVLVLGLEGLGEVLLALDCQFMSEK